jgi:hypothetical protein
VKVLQLDKQEYTSNHIDWRISVGTVVSGIWLLLLGLYLSQQVSWQQFLGLPLDQVGSFLGGAFSPLAFLWLVIGFFIQQREIDDNTQNIAIQAQHTNLDNFLKMSDIIYQHLSVISGFLVVSCQEDFEAVSAGQLNFEDDWSKASTGDSGIFVRTILSYQFDGNTKGRDMAQIFFSTPIRHGHSLKYKTVFEDLLDNSFNCDSSGGLREALVDGTVWGILYKIIVETENEKKQQN